MRKYLIIAFLLAAAATAFATTLPLCTITGVVTNPDGTPCANCQINFNPPNNRAQVCGGSAVVFPQAVYTTTDANGNLAPISLIQGTQMVVTIQNPTTGGYSANIAVGVPSNVGTTFTQLVAQNNLAPGASVVNGLSVGTRTLTPTAANCAAGVCTSLATDFMLACDASAGNVTYDLPASSGGGRWIDFEKVDSSANTCTLQTSGVDTINGVATETLTNQYDGVLINDKQVAKWFVNAGTGTKAFPNPLPCLNGIRCNEVNVASQPGFSSWMGNISCTISSPSSKQATCTGIGSTPLTVGTWIAIYGAGPNPTTTTPTGIEFGPIHKLTTPGGSDSTTLASGCTTQNAYAWCTSGNPLCTVSNSQMYEAGDTVSIAGAVSSQAISLMSGNFGAVGANASQIEFGAGGDVTGTVNGIAMTGANCSRSRSYEVFAIDALGGWSAPTAVQTSTSTANGLTQSNYVAFQVATQSNAVAYVLAGYEASNSTQMHIIDVQVPSYTYANQSATNWWDKDALVAWEVTKAAPTTITLHDYGTPYGRDWNQGTVTIYDPSNGATDYTAGAVPSGAYPEIFYSKIAAISGNTITFNDAPSQTGTFTMVADAGPAINSAIAQACDSNHNCGAVYLPPYVATSNAGFSIVTPLVMQNGIGLQFYSETPIMNGDGSQSGSAQALDGFLNYRGPIGGTGLYINNETRPFIRNIQLNGMTTMGVGLDIDKTGTPTTTQVNLDHVLSGQSSVSMRLSNTASDNVEFGVLSDIYANIVSGGPSGFIGLLNNGPNSTRTKCTMCQLWGQKGLVDIRSGFDMDHGQAGGPFGATAIVLPTYYQDQSSFRDLRDEHVSLVLESFMASNGGAALNSPEFDNDTFTDLRLLGTGDVYQLTGDGTLKITQTNFITTNWGQQNGDCSDPEIANFFSFYQPTLTGVNSYGNTYSGVTSPFTGLSQSGFWSQADQYLGCSRTLIQTHGAPISGLAISNTCPFTIPNPTGGYYTDASCSFAFPGGTQTFPVTVTTANAGCIGVMVNEQTECRWTYSFNGSTNNLKSLSFYDPTGAAILCSANNSSAYGAFDASVSGNSIVVTNNTQISNTPLQAFVTAKSGACQ